MKNGIKYLIAGLVATGLTASASYAAITANFTASDISFVTDNTGASNYLTGGLVEIGMFTTAPTVGSTNLANFVEFGSTLAADGAFAGAGAAATAGAFSHAQIYMVVFNQATATFGPGTQLAIADVNDTTNPLWRFPADSDVPNSTTLDLDTLFSGSNGSLATGATVFYGSTGTDGAGPYNLLETAPVVIPEPSTYVLVGTGLLGLLGLRRRNK